MGLSPTQQSRLYDAFRQSRIDLKPARKDRKDRIEQRAGKDYRDHVGYPDTDKMPYNLYELAHGIYKRSLVANNPRVSCTTPRTNLKSVADSLGLMLNQRIEAMRMLDTLTLVVDDAITLMGVAQLCLDGGNSYPSREGEEPRDGKLCFDWIDFDDWVHDTSVRRLCDGQFKGHSYIVPLEWVQQNKEFSAKARNNIGDDNGSEEGEDVREGEDRELRDEYRFEKVCRLWQLWLPDRGKLVVFHRTPMNILYEQEWTGPSYGPYHELAFDPVPSRDMPHSPGSVWKDLSFMCNRLMIKLLRQADRQKDIPIFRGQSQEDAERMVNASDGVMTRFDGPIDDVGMKRMGGIDPNTLVLLMQLQGIAFDMWGGLGVLGGIGPQSDTVGQDRLLDANASKRLASMGESVLTFTQRVSHDMAWYHWTDPGLHETLTDYIEVAGKRVEYSYDFTAADLRGEFFDFNFRVEPYSMQHRTPAQRAQAVLQLYQSVVLPSLPLLMQQGMGINMDALMRLLAKGLDIPELADIIVFTGMPPGGAAVQPPGMAPNTTRTYERVNRPGNPSAKQKADVVTQVALAGLNRQPSEMAGVMRGGT